MSSNLPLITAQLKCVGSGVSVRVCAWVYVCVGRGRCGCGSAWEQLVLSLAEYCTFVSVKGVCGCIRMYVHCCTGGGVQRMTTGLLELHILSGCFV